MDIVVIIVFALFLAQAWGRVNNVEIELQKLRRELQDLKKSRTSQAASSAPAAGVWPEPARASATDTPAAAAWSDWDQSSSVPPSSPATQEAPPAPAAAAPQPETVIASVNVGDHAHETPAQKRDFEFNFGKKLPVWIGGVALAFAGFYLVKYSIDMGLLTPEVRIALGFLFGIALLGAGAYIRAKSPDMADGARIAQALTGAGIADLYATIFAATTVLHLMYPPAGFAGMAIVTAIAVILSVRHGMPIAILGLLGGFLTPALIQTGHPNAAGLFIYLLMLVVGFFSVITMLAWWVLAIPVLVLSFLWVPIWLLTDFQPDDGIWLSLFLLAVTAVAVFAAQKSGGAGENAAPGKTLGGGAGWGKKTGYLAVAGGITLMAVVTGQSDFALEDWALYGVLGAGCIALAWARPALYSLAPWLSMAASLLLLTIWDHETDATYALTLLAFALMYGGGGFFLLRAQPNLKAAGLLSTAALCFFGLGFFRIHEHLYTLLDMEHTDILHLWGILAIALASGFTLLTVHFLRHFRGEDSLRQQILAVTSLTATAFLSVALTVEVRNEFLAVAFAAETLAVCWINLKVDVKALRQIAGILFAVFVFLMGEQLLMLFAVTINSLFGETIDFWHGHLPLAEDPIFQLGLPMAMMGLSSYLVQRDHDGRLAEVFEMAAAGLGALLIYYVTRHVFHVPKEELFHKLGFGERGIITNLFFGAGLAVAYGGRLYSRRALVWSGTAIFAMALFRVFWFDFLTQNPLFNAHMEVGSAFLFNSLVLPYLLPCFWLWLEDRPQLRLVTMSPSLKGGMILALLFTYISLNVRQSFHGTMLAGEHMTNAEVYAYSVVWLMLGGFLLFFGTARKDKPMRVASLVIMILTIGKVFLYDASELSGLYRVFSFMGLGLSLMALSWFYSRFIFKKET